MKTEIPTNREKVPAEYQSIIKETPIGKIISKVFFKPFLGLSFDEFREIGRLAEIEEQISAGKISDPKKIEQFHQDAKRLKKSLLATR